MKKILLGVAIGFVSLFVALHIAAAIWGEEDPLAEFGACERADAIFAREWPWDEFSVTEREWRNAHQKAIQECIRETLND